MLLPFLKSNPEPPTQRNEQLIPEYTANIFDKISFGWIYPLLKVSRTSSHLPGYKADPLVLKTGYTRPIEENDVWHLDDDRLTHNVTNRLERNFYDRCPPSRRPLHYGGSSSSSAAVIVATQGGKDVVAKDTGHPRESNPISEKGGDTVNDATGTSSSDSLHDSNDTNSTLVDRTNDALLQQISIRDKTLSVSAAVMDPAEGYVLNSCPNAAAAVPSLKEDPTTMPHTSVKSKAPPSCERTLGQRLLSRLNPWSALRKEDKVRQGRLHYEMDEHGQYRYYDSSLVIALLQTTWRPLLLATFYKGSRTVIEMTSSLVTKQLIAFITTSHTWAHATDDERSEGNLKVPKKLGHGIGLAIGLALMQQIALLCGNHYHLKSYGCGK
jgi:hypothetical protein